MANADPLSFPFFFYPVEGIDTINGRSLRVGATQDLFPLNIEPPAVMQAGRWKSARMPRVTGNNCSRPEARRRGRRRSRDGTDPFDGVTRRARGRT
ncbi:MAG: hypothetical protein R3E77_10470 [Steroidobacteraceae bacterium]